jgi:hypothetical protein
MARILQGQKMWEELAEDPFRGLRAGPATFSPFLFPANCEPRTRFNKPLKSLKKSSASKRRSAPIEENTKLCDGMALLSRSW